MQNPSQIHFRVAKRIVRYLQGTKDFGMLYRSTDDFKLIEYIDSDWAGSVNDMKSTSGYAFMLRSSIFSWSSKKQDIVAQSSAEAEYITAASASSQASWLRRILKDLGEQQTKAMEV